MNNNFFKFFIGLSLAVVLVASGFLTYKYLYMNENKKINQYSDEEKMQIYNAIIKGNISDYEKYLDDGKKLSFSFEDGTTPLEKLIESNDILNAEKIINNGFDLNIVENNHIDTVSNILVYNKDYNIPVVNDIAKDLILQIKDEIEKEDTYGYSLLMNAIYTNNLELVKEILKYTKNVDIVYNDETALTFACSLGNVDIEIVKELVQKGANVNYQGDEGYNCLMNAISNNQSDLVLYLMSLENIDINIQNDYGQTVLHVCVEYTNLNAIDIILQNKKINKNILDNDGYTAKEYANYLSMEEFANKL